MSGCVALGLTSMMPNVIAVSVSDNTGDKKKNQHNATQ